MAAFRRGVLYVPPLVQCRHRGKINIQRPRPGTHQRRIFEAITQPVIPDTLHNPHEACPRLPRLMEEAQTEQLHPLEQILIRDCKESFEKHRLIIAFYLLPFPPRQQPVVKNKLLNKGVRLRYFSNPIMRHALTGSKWENLLQIVTGKMVYGVAEDPDVLSGLVKELKKIPELHILGGVLDQQLLTRAGMLRAAELPPMDMLLGQTCSILGSRAAETKSLLSSHQQTLSVNLQQYVKDQTGGSTS